MLVCNSVRHNRRRPALVSGVVFSGSVDGHLRGYSTDSQEDRVGFRHRAAHCHRRPGVKAHGDRLMSVDGNRGRALLPATVRVWAVGVASAATSSSLVQLQGKAKLLALSRT